MRDEESGRSAEQEGVQVQLTGSSGETSGHAAAVREALDRVRSRWQTLAVLRLGATIAAVIAGVWLVGWVAVRSLALGGGALALVAAAAAAVSLAACVAAVVRRRPVPGDRVLARYIEEQYPALEDRLATAVEVVGSTPEADPGVRAAMLADASRALGDVPLDTIVPRERVRRAGVVAAVCGLAVIVAAALWIEPGRQAFRVAALYAIPGRLVLQVSPGDARVKRGDPFTIAAATSSGEAGISPELTVTIGDQRRTVRMPAAGGDRFAWRFDAVPASFTYSVSAAGRTSETYTVTALDPPRVARIDLRYVFPEYTRLPPREEEDGGDIYAPNGTRVTLSIHASTGVTAGALSLDGGARVPLEAAAGGRFEATLPITADGSYRVALTDGDGLRSDGDTEYFIHVLNDRPPDVRILRPAGDRQVTPLEEITIEARADDDYGVGAFDLVYSIRGTQETSVPFAGDRAGLSVTGRHTLFLEDLGVEPGDFVTYYARVRDVARGRRSTEARSDIFFLEVKPFEEEFAAAQSQAGAGSGDRSLDDLVTAQKDIVVATWKLERRAAAGRSAQDVRAVGRAQGELKERVDRAAVSRRDPRRRPRVVEGDTIGSAPADPLTSAAAAMGRAKAALDAVRTAEALPPEMEALNHLMRAQAEIKRRDVMRQQANGASAGGSNRSQQDLSSLFDRELQRQQQTNYETRQSTEERQDGRSKDASLDKVRELARRQEQLARQQNELARDRERLSAEEVKRRLERLTREQSDLRQQAEELSRQIGQQQARQQAQQGERGQQPGERSERQQAMGEQARGQQPGDQPGSGQANGAEGQGRSSGAASAQLREASEEMRGATSDLRRQDPRQASARSSRALERLRSLERQLQAAGPDERRRALGDLQLEARQLAERQRALGEAAATEAAASTAADARRRLAGDQDRLADRVKRLQEGVKEMETAAGAAAPEVRQAVGDAARQIEQERVEARMRESASALRSADQGSAERAATRAASTARDLARSMDRVADRLGAASGDRNADDRKVADQLARTRELKEQMNDLQRQIQRLGREAQTPDGQPPDGQRGTGSRADAGSQSQGGQPGAGGEAQRQLEQLREQYAQGMREAEQLRQELGSERQNAPGGTTPEGQQMVASAPGTEAFKQDFSRWETLHKDVTLGLERIEASLSRSLLERAARDRLEAGAADRAPDEYERAVEAYFRSLAAPKP